MSALLCMYHFKFKKIIPKLFAVAGKQKTMLLIEGECGSVVAQHPKRGWALALG